jgi:glutamate synthase (NADPH/NADH) small chain
VLIATGVYKAPRHGRARRGLQGVVPALDYLIASNRRPRRRVPNFDARRPRRRAGKDVVVVGGGDTAMDCVRTAVRQGAKSVTCLYRRDKANMPGSMREVSNAEEEGVIFEWLAAPRAVLRRGHGRDRRARRRMRLGPPDASGRQAPEEIEGADFDRPAQLVIKALGFDPEDLPTAFGPDLKTTRWGTVKADLRTMMTNLDGVFAGRRHRSRRLAGGLGDPRRPRRRRAMHRYLRAQGRRPRR